MKNYYQTLGLNHNASKEEIKRAYRKLAIKFHPDKNQGDDFFNEMFREIKNAYDILSNPVLKREYDIKYKAFINTTYVDNKNKSQNREKYNQTNRRKSRTKSTIFSRLYSFLKKNISIHQFSSFKNFEYKKKLKFLLQILLLSLLLFGIIENGIAGFFSVAGFYLCIYLFYDSIKNSDQVKSVESVMIGFLVAPVGAFMILGYSLDYYEINPLNWSNNTRSVQNNYSPFVYERGYQAEPYKNDPMTDGEKKIYELRREQKELEKMFAEVKMDNSKYEGNQLENGMSPLDSCFGKGIYAQNAWLKFDNSNNRDAIVCLVQLNKNKTIRNEYIRAGTTFEMSKIPTGTYYMKVYYGNDWNPDKINFCGIRGAFEKNISFSKSDKIGDHIKIENNNTSYTTGIITLYPVDNGNMSTEKIDEQSFFEN